ncbi:hypothetical protein DPMN_121820 [Dreissena polymorpha]|uniref:Uncharacterized protein n=1 Tax=Dreissena polymorpha TaxID=45954 RepID=A0A9D4GRB4_DREPO|nr:hypothetical protein DPMN_121820 [Dreissena polymorpha]
MRGEAYAICDNQEGLIPAPGSWVAMEISTILTPARFYSLLPMGVKSLDNLDSESSSKKSKNLNYILAVLFEKRWVSLGKCLGQQGSNKTSFIAWRQRVPASSRGDCGGEVLTRPTRSMIPKSGSCHKIRGIVIASSSCCPPSDVRRLHRAKTLTLALKSKCLHLQH